MVWIHRTINVSLIVAILAVLYLPYNHLLDLPWNFASSDKEIVGINSEDSESCSTEITEDECCIVNSKDCCCAPKDEDAAATQLELANNKEASSDHILIATGPCGQSQYFETSLTLSYLPSNGNDESIVCIFKEHSNKFSIHDKADQANKLNQATSYQYTYNNPLYITLSIFRC